MTTGPRRESQRLAQATAELDAAVKALEQRQSEVKVALDTNGIAAQKQPPLGYRWVTTDEIAQEFNDPKTLPARCMQLLGMRCGLVPLETVLIPVVVKA